MTAIRLFWAQFNQDRRAVTALEYGIIAAAVVAIGLAGFTVLGNDLHTKMNSVATEVSN